MTALGIFIWFSPVFTRIVLQREGKNDFLAIHVRILYIIPFTKIIPLFSLEEGGFVFRHRTDAPFSAAKEKKGRTSFRKVRQYRMKLQRIVDRVRNFYRMIRRFLAKIKVNHLMWFTEIGSGDAASSALLTGLVWNIKGALLMVMDHLVKMGAKPSIQVIPKFNEKVFRTHLEISLEFPLGEAIRTVFHFIRHLRKGREKNGRTSNSGLDEYGDGEYKEHG